MKTNSKDMVAVDSCMLVYGPKNTMKQQLMRAYKASNIRFHNIREVDMQFCTFDIGKDKYLVIRGTKGQKDIITDLDVFSYDPLLKRIILRHKHGKQWVKSYKKEIKRIKGVIKSMKFRLMHFGFFKSAEAIATYMVKNGLEPDYIMGHSLGGGVAHPLAMFMTHTLKGIITFGAPRSGGIKFALMYNRRYKKITRRFFNDKDVVPKVPFRIMFFMHVAKGLYFNHKGRLKNRIEQFRDLGKYFTKSNIKKDIKIGIADYKKTKKIPEFIQDHLLDTINPLGYYNNVRKNMV